MSPCKVQVIAVYWKRTFFLESPLFILVIDQSALEQFDKSAVTSNLQPSSRSQQIQGSGIKGKLLTDFITISLSTLLFLLE